MILTTGYGRAGLGWRFIAWPALARTVPGLCTVGGCHRSQSSVALNYGQAMGEIRSHKRMADAAWADLGEVLERGAPVDAKRVNEVGQASVKCHVALAHVRTDFGHGETASDRRDQGRHY